MKQTIISYLDTIKEELFKLSSFLYNNPEESYREYKACEYITQMLETKGFMVKPNYLNIPTAFYAVYGSGYPTIAFFCEYDAAPSSGHISGHNLISPMSLGAAFALSKVIGKTGGSIVVLGCPGEYVGGAKITMAKEGTFKDIDAAMMAHPDTITCENINSKAIVPLCIRYTEAALAKLSPSSACKALLNTINTLVSEGEEEIDKITICTELSPYTPPSYSELKFYIRSETLKAGEELESTIKTLSKSLGVSLGLSCTFSYFELPCRELSPNSSLSRLFINNLKESGIIDIAPSRISRQGLSLGTVSELIPCIHPFIKITEQPSIAYPSPEFAAATLTPYAGSVAIKTAAALAFTALDLIEKKSLLQEIKSTHNNA